MSQKRTPADATPTHADLCDAMDKAMVRISIEDIAKATGCGVNTLRQSRMKPGTRGYRSPPAGLLRALHELCKARAKYFLDLAEQLRPPKGS